VSNGQRIGLLVVTVAVLVLAFVVLNPGGGGDSDDPPETVAGPPPAATAPATTATTAPEPQPQFTKILVRDAKPVGGAKTVKAEKGERVRIEVSSADTTDEVHLHGYDIAKDLKAGGRVRFSFTANAEGIFEMELEGAHVQIAQIEVRPG